MKYKRINVKCSECDNTFNTNSERDKTCSPDCRIERAKRINREWYYNKYTKHGKTPEKKITIVEEICLSCGETFETCRNEKYCKDCWSIKGIHSLHNASAIETAIANRVCCRNN